MHNREHAKGLAITVLGVLILTPDTLLIRLVGVDVWNLVMWRGALQCVGLMLILAAVYRGRALAVCRAIGAWGVLVAVLFSASTFCFVTSIAHTKVANTLILLAAAPFFAAVLSALILREHPPMRTWIAIGVALAGIALLVFEGVGAGTLLGDLAGLGAALALAFKFTVVRRLRHLSMVPAMALSGLASSLVAGALADPVALDGTQLGCMLLMGLVVVPVSLSLITLGPRYLPAPEVALILLLETVLGPLWVWAVLRERPGELALAGGIIVVGALVGHSIVGLRRQPCAGVERASPAVVEP